MRNRKKTDLALTIRQKAVNLLMAIGSELADRDHQFTGKEKHLFNSLYRLLDGKEQDNLEDKEDTDE